MKTPRSLRALFVFAAFHVSLTVLGGGLLLIMSHPHPDVTQPVWQFGQWMLFLGIIHFLIYAGIYWQVRKMLSEKLNE